jgi:hypothetical protein
MVCRSVHRQSHDRRPRTILRKTAGHVDALPVGNGLLGLTYLSSRSNLTRPVVAKNIPGFLPGPHRSFFSSMSWQVSSCLPVEVFD